MIGDGVGNPLELLIIVRRLVHDVLVLQPLEDGPLDRYPGVIGHVRHYRSRRRGRPELPRVGQTNVPMSGNPEPAKRERHSDRSAMYLDWYVA